MLISDGSESFECSNRAGISFISRRFSTSPLSCGQGLCEKKPVRLSGDVETDEAYITAGHKGHPAIVASERAKADAES